MTIIVVSLLLYFGLLNFGTVRKYLGLFITIVTPFIVGGCVAFILNVPMRWIERLLTRLFSRRTKSVPAAAAKKTTETGTVNKSGQTIETQTAVKAKKVKKKSPVGIFRIASMLLTLVIFAGVIVAVVFLVAPEVGHSINMIIDKYPDFAARAEKTAADLAVKYPAVKDYITSYDINWMTIGQSILNFTKTAGGSLLSSTIGVATSIFGIIFSSIIAFVFAVNILLQKEKLGLQARKIIYAFLPETAADKTIYICSLSSNTFARFLSGQGRESLILGSMFLITLSIFRFPYALLISVLIAVLSLIPMFGAFIGCVFGVFFILIVDPVMALWFVVIFVILQQIEGNLIYPRVVGGSIGLPSIWVLVAVTVGGSLFGVIGMLVFIPMSSVLYVLFREIVNKRLSDKKIQEEKMNPQ